MPLIILVAILIVPVCLIGAWGLLVVVFSLPIALGLRFLILAAVVGVFAWLWTRRGTRSRLGGPWK